MARGILGASVFRGPRARQQGLPLSRSYQAGGAVDPMGIAPIFQSPLLTPEEELASQNQNQSVMDVGAGAQVGTGSQVGSQDVSGNVLEQRTDGYTDFLARSAPVDPVPAEDPYASISGRIRAEARRRDVPDNFLDVYANAGYRRRQGLERFLMSREYKPDAFAQPTRVPFEETSFYRPPVQSATTTVMGGAPAGGTGDVSGADAGSIGVMGAPDTETFPVSAEPDPMDGEPSQEPAGDTVVDTTTTTTGDTVVDTTTTATDEEGPTASGYWEPGYWLEHEYGKKWIEPVWVDTTDTTVSGADTGDAQTGQEVWEDAEDQLQKDVADGTQTTDDTVVDDDEEEETDDTVVDDDDDDTDDTVVDDDTDDTDDTVVDDDTDDTDDTVVDDDTG
jgi:hypothetical protein